MKTEVLKPSLSNSSICVHKVTKATRDSSYGIHFHKECEMYLCIEGETFFYINDREYQLHTGDIVFVNEFMPHRTATRCGTRSFLIQFAADSEETDINKYLRRFSSYQSCNCALFESGTAENEEIKHYLLQIIKENAEQNKAYDKYIKACVTQIIAALHRYDILQDAQEFFRTNEIARLLPVIEYINKHYSEEIHLESMSKLLNIDKSHFCRIFKRAMNTSFVKYLNFVRVCKAERLLLETNKTVAQISEEVGFSSPAYFTEIFRQSRFCSPRLYKKMKTVN